MRAHWESWGNTIKEKIRYNFDQRREYTKSVLWKSPELSTRVEVVVDGLRLLQSVLFILFTIATILLYEFTDSRADLYQKLLELLEPVLDSSSPARGQLRLFHIAQSVTK